MYKLTILAATLLLPVAALAAGYPGSSGSETPPPRQTSEGMPARRPAPSVEHAAMQHLLAEALAQRSGRAVGEIEGLLLQQGPRGVGEQLGLEPQAMHELMRNTRRTLIQRAQQAGLISAAQAQRLGQEMGRDQEPGGPGQRTPRGG